jgi:hypothetical protein
MSEPIASLIGWFDKRLTLFTIIIPEDERAASMKWHRLNELQQLEPFVERLRVALHDSEAGPQDKVQQLESAIRTDLHRHAFGPVGIWTGLMAGFAPADMDFSTTNSGDVGGPLAEKP